MGVGFRGLGLGFGGQLSEVDYFKGVYTGDYEDLALGFWLGFRGSRVQGFRV